MPTGRPGRVFSFLRRAGNSWALVVVPRCITGLASDGGLPLGQSCWQDTRLVLPMPGPGFSFRNIFTGEEAVPREDQGRPTVRVAEVLASFPVAILVGENADGPRRLDSMEGLPSRRLTMRMQSFWQWPGCRKMLSS